MKCYILLPLPRCLHAHVVLSAPVRAPVKPVPCYGIGRADFWSDGIKICPPEKKNGLPKLINAPPEIVEQV